MTSGLVPYQRNGWLAGALAVLMISTAIVLSGSSEADASRHGAGAPVEVINTPLPVDVEDDPGRLIDGGTDGFIVDVLKGGPQLFPLPADVVLTDIIMGISGGACTIELVRGSEILLTYYKRLDDHDLFDSISLNSGIVSDGGLEFKVTPLTTDQDNPCIVTTLRWTGYELRR